MHDDLFDIRGQVIIVTGSGRGLGQSLAEGFGLRGASVVVTGRTLPDVESVADRIIGNGGSAMAVQLDVTDPASVEDLMLKVQDRFGAIDVLVNNAGQTSKRIPALDIDLADFSRIIDTNIMGTFLLAQAAARAMARRGTGRIINVASTSALLIRHNLPNSTYAASKAAVSMLTKALADEWASLGILVNCVAPGRFVVDSHKSMEAPGSKGHDQVLATIPLGRTGEPEELLGPFLLFASKAGSYVTGQTLFVDGGRTVL